MAPNINNPGGVKNDPDEIRDGVVSDSTRFPGGFIDERVTESGAPVQIAGQFRLNNASFLHSFDVSPQESTPTGVSLQPDGSRLYVVGASGASVYQYDLPTNYDITTASFTTQFDLAPTKGNPLGMTLKPDGSQMYVSENDSDTIRQYGLSTSFDVSTASLTQTFDVSSQDGTPAGIAFSPDGTDLLLAGKNTTTVYQYDLSTGFDISTASLSTSFNVSSQETSPTGVTVQPDGSTLYVIGDSSQTVHQYDLSTPFDVSTASLTRSFSVSSEDTQPNGLVFRDDGSQLYIVGRTGVNVYQYAVGKVVGEFV